MYFPRKGHGTNLEIRRLLLLLAVLTTGWLPTALAARTGVPAAAAARERQVGIGALLPLGGAFASAGQSRLAALEIGVEETNREYARLRSPRRAVADRGMIRGCHRLDPP